MSYKKDCGFKEKANVCSFREEDCKPEECDFYNIEFSVKAIKKQVGIERKKVIQLTDDMKEFKRKGYKKDNPEGYKKLKKERKDKVIGIIKFSKCIMHLKRTKK